MYNHCNPTTINTAITMANLPPYVCTADSTVILGNSIGMLTSAHTSSVPIFPTLPPLNNVRQKGCGVVRFWS